MYPSSQFHQEIARDRHAQLLRDARAVRPVEVATDELGPGPAHRLFRLAAGRIGRRVAARASLAPV